MSPARYKDFQYIYCWCGVTSARTRGQDLWGKMRCELLAERIKVPMLDVVQVVEHNFQWLGGVVRGLILLRRQRFFFGIPFTTVAPQGTEPYAALPFQFMLIVMKIYFGYLAVRGTTPMRDLGHRCVTRE